MPVDPLALLDWRRRVAELYAGVRARYRHDPVGAHAHWARERDALFRRHPASPAGTEPDAARPGLEVAPYDPELAFAARLDTDVAPARYEVATSTGATVVFHRVGRVELPIGTLEALWLDAYADGLFLPLADATSGTETYGGGRYLLDTPKGADLGTVDGRLVVDANFAYHPSCHYRPTWSCPLAPPQNRLDARLLAGELTWPGADA